MDYSAPEIDRRKRKSRGRGLRKSTGCLTCRRRHLKCDEVAPSCGPCSKSNQGCVYAAPITPLNGLTQGATVRSVPNLSETQRTEQRDFGHTAQWQTSVEEVHQSQSQSQDFRGWDRNSHDHERTQATIGLMSLRSGGPPIERSRIPSPNATTDYSTPSVGNSGDPAVYASAITPPNTAFFRWFGLLTNDASQLGGNPGFGADVNDISHDATSTSIHGLCVLSPQTTTADLANSQEVISASKPVSSSLQGNPPSGLSLSQPPKRQPWQGSDPPQLLAHEQAILENFVKNISAWIDLFDPARHFSTLVPHLAMHDAGLMNAILALSCRHLSLQSDADDGQRDRNVAIQYYYDTLHYLQEAMRFDTYTVSLELLATALIVSTYEMLDDFGSGWERHLQGVFWIQRSQLIQGESGGLKQAVWWAWLRQDVWAAFRERRKTFSFWKPSREYSDMTAYEIASRSIWLFARAVDYSSTDEIKTGEVNLQARIEKADSIMGMLDEWKRNLTIEFQPLPSGSGSPAEAFEQIWIHPPAFGVALQLYYSARILILLHRPSLGGVRSYMEQQRLLGISVETICGIAMTLTDDASSLMSSQCLFVAGLCPQGSRKRVAILELIDNCQRRTGWPTRSLSEELKVEWEQSDIK